jgi:hypothetical protein
MRPCPIQTKFGSKPLIGPPAANRSAPERGHTAERHHKWRHLQPRNRKSLQKAAGNADHNRGERGEIPGVTCRFLARADRKAIGNTAFRHRRRNQSGKSNERTD